MKKKKLYCEWCGVQIEQSLRGRNPTYCPACATMIEHFGRYLRNAFKFVFGESARIQIKTSINRIQIEGVKNDTRDSGKQPISEAIPARQSVGINGRH